MRKTSSNKQKIFLFCTNLGNMFIFSLLSDIMLCAYIKMKSIKIPTHIELLKKKTNKEANCELMQHEVGAASVGRDWSRIQPWPPREIQHTALIVTSLAQTSQEKLTFGSLSLFLCLACENLTAIQATSALGRKCLFIL